jgi:hypothetical protein
MPISRKPNWGKWLYVPEVSVKDVVALSLDIDPDKVKISPHGWMGDTVIFEESQEFSDRIAVVRANLNKHPGLKLTQLIVADPLDSCVYLSRFHLFTKSVNWTLPPEFPQGESSECVVQVNRDRWLAQDAWSEAEFRDLLCGLEPNAARESTEEPNRAHEEIRRAVLMNALPVKSIGDATKADHFYAHHWFYAPDDAIRWAASKLPLFPKFPFRVADSKQPMETPVTEYMAGRILIEFERHLQEEIAKRQGRGDPAADALAHALLHLKSLEDSSSLAKVAIAAAQESNESGRASATDSEIRRLKKSIAVLALAIAERTAKYKRGDMPNATQRADLITDIVDARPDCAWPWIDKYACCYIGRA